MVTASNGLLQHCKCSCQLVFSVHTPSRAKRIRPAGLRCAAQLRQPVECDKMQAIDRRRTLMASLLLPPLLDTSLRALWPESAHASLVQFPVSQLKNRYFLIRAGESVAESRGSVLSNPVAKTSVDSGLSEDGKRQVVKQTVPALKAAGVDPETDSIWMWPSITQRSYQTAEIVGSLLGIGRSRIVPEYSFLDPRGVGQLEGYTLSEAAAQIEAGDRQSPDWRPFHGTDGTPNESVNDCLVRMRQVVSITETQWSGATVLIISPDSDLLSVVQAAALGVDLRDHRRFSFAPGEARPFELAPELPPAEKSSKFACPRPPSCV